MPEPHLRPPTVDFIDSRLPRYHPAFANPSVQYDPMAKQYTSPSQALVPAPSNSISGAPSINNGPTHRPIWTDTNAMNFWNSIFPEAMKELRSVKEPKGRSNTTYDIRNKPDWDSIYDVLELAREKYQKSDGIRGRLRKVRRKGADGVTPAAESAKIAAKIAPNDPSVTPILGAIEVLLNAVKTAASVRNQVLSGFDGLMPIFSDVELFLGTFPRDENIRNASIILTATTLEAIERAIGFFISNEFWRGGKAVFTGDDYEQSLLESLDGIQTKSRELMQEATKSHIHEFHMYSQETKRIHHQLVNMLGHGLSSMNSIERLLADHVRQRDQEFAAVQQENLTLKVEIERLRTASPFQNFIYAPPPQQTQAAAPAIIWRPSQDDLRRMLDSVDIDLTDAASVDDKKEQFPPRQRVQAEGIIGTHLFQNWIVSPSSAKLLVQWDFQLPKTIAGVSPLSVFCTTMAQSLCGKERFVLALFICGLHIDGVESDGRVGGRTMLACLIDQLLRQHVFEMRLLEQYLDYAEIQKGNIHVLIRLLVELTRQLPRTKTVFFVIDGVVLFEREEFQAEALDVFSTLLRLASDARVCASVKILFTSTPGTDIIRGAFEDQDLILNVNSLPRLVWAASEERMTRELEGELSGDAD